MADPEHPIPSHLPVLPNEVIDLLAPAAGETYVDCTAGLGGHARLVAERLGPTGTVVLNDHDAGNLRLAEARVRELAGDAPTVVLRQGSFSGLPAWMAERGLAADLLLADLGFSSNQVDDPARGLSFKREGPLDMRLDQAAAHTAAEIVHQASESELADIIFQYGEDRLSRRIARKIVEARARGPILTTADLAREIRAAYPPPRRGGRGGRGPMIDPATRTFQALRIAVNDELGELERLLAALADAAERLAGGDFDRKDSGPWLRPGARVGIMAFHSLEDRPVKRAFLDLAQRGLAERMTRKPVTATEGEAATNPRARSAKLRVVRLPGGAPGGREAGEGR